MLHVVYCYILLSTVSAVMCCYVLLCVVMLLGIVTCCYILLHVVTYYYMLLYSNSLRSTEYKVFIFRACGNMNTAKTRNIAIEASSRQTRQRKGEMGRLSFFGNNSNA